MFPAFVRIGPLELSTYSAILGLGLIGSIGLGVWQGQRRGLVASRLFDVTLLAAVGGLVGARIAYVAVNWVYYRDHVSEALRMWSGGLAWQGGLGLALLLVLVTITRSRLPRAKVLDALALGWAWFTLCLWLGSGVANDVYGRETWPGDGLWWRLSADLPDLYGLRAPRINVALLGVGWSALVLAAIGLLTRFSKRPGISFFTYLLLTGLGGLWLVPLQASPAPYLLRARLDGWFYLTLVGAGLCGLIVVKRRNTSLQNQGKGETNDE